MSINLVSVRNRHCRLYEAELVSKVLRHQAVLIRAGSECVRASPWPYSRTPVALLRDACSNIPAATLAASIRVDFPALFGPTKKALAPRVIVNLSEGLVVPQVELLDAHGFHPTAVFRDGTLAVLPDGNLRGCAIATPVRIRQASVRTDNRCPFSLKLANKHPIRHGHEKEPEDFSHCSWRNRTALPS